MTRIGRRREESRQQRELDASRREFRDLKDRCQPSEMVCGTIRPDGRPVYFLAPLDSTDAHLEERSFEARYGRERLPGEMVLAEMAAKRPEPAL